MNANSLDMNSLPLESSETQAAANAQTAQGAFAYAYSATMDSVAGQTSGLPGALGAGIKEYLWRAEMLANNGERSLQIMLGDPQYMPVADRQTGELRRGRFYPNPVPFATKVLNDIAADINALEKDAQDMQGQAAQLVAAVYRESAQTNLPKYGANETRQAELKNDMTALLDSARTPQTRLDTALDLINKLVADADDEGLSVLLGKRMELVRQRLGLDYDALCRQVFRARLDKCGGDPNAQMAPRYAKFLSRQWDGDTSLGAVAMKAAARLRQAHAYARRHAGR